MRFKTASIFIFVLCASASPARATYDDLIGFPELQALLGGSIPTGAGIAIQHVEATSGSAYMPFTGSGEYSGKVPGFTNVTLTAGASQGSAAGSNHSNSVGANFYGNNTSIAPGINDMQVYEAAHWLGFDVSGSTVTATATSFLNTTLNMAPDTTGARIANHSYIQDFSTNTVDLEVVRRVDFTVAQDDLFNVVGLPNSSNPNLPLLKSAYNVISVGTTPGTVREGTLQVGTSSVYTAGRNAPHVVTPGFNPPNSGCEPSDGCQLSSFATPMVSAAVALLLEVGQDSGLSNGMIANRTRTINHAETTEVIKAVLMAGADRFVDNLRGADLANYAIDTDNNLDLEYGAGQVNVLHNYRILSASEQDSVQDGNGADIGPLGWDYDPDFGGAGGTNESGSYFFDAPNDGTLYATLAWNLNVFDSDPGAGFTPAEEYFDLDLLLIDVTGGGIPLTNPGASSTSLNENTENVFFTGLVAGNRYELRVVRGSGQGEFEHDYGLAWRIATVPEPGGWALVLMGIGTFGGFRRRVSRTASCNVV